MADDKSQSWEPDKGRVNTNEDYEVKYWATKFAVSSEDLVNAVKAVGTLATDVEQYLKTKK